MRGLVVAGKAFADEGLVHHAEHRHALVQQRDQRAPDRKARDEGFGAVDRIQHPDVIGIGALVAELLADDAVLGKLRLDQPPHHSFRCAVGFGHGIEILGDALVVDRQRRAEERQDGLAGSRGEPPDEGGEIDDRHCGIPGRAPVRKTVVLPSSIAGFAHDDPAFSVGILMPNQPAASADFPVTGGSRKRDITSFVWPSFRG
jgi:hypothetical protein